MPFNNILQNIRRFTSLSTQEEKAFCALLSIRKVKRKEFLLREGTVCNFEWYVNSGCFRSFYIDKKGLEHNIYFAIEDWWTSDLYSRTTQEPSNCNIIALEESEVVQIKHAELEAFMVEVPAMERFFRISYQQSLVNQHLKNLRLLSMNGEERYIHFREKYPQLAKRIPQKHIATFLGLTPEFFNTIHARVLRLR
ncbi:Crp/Fnr family transcriptional regulator [Niastella yeongjuensis]|uniref:Crp/Fnr family transcriptional regulator n=1 Tax=Niastella yeongjuensis TaxID=354355 RepID=A0A1V9DXM7_9BACT|nr:Crp/Fnr family transcriptional regulator [Niastella yeongjuensis]OQP38627.1 Crp/Fnr family transcriptional regulator [Niastella yeongjuensis]SEO38972.1 cAMP-binding domain of CRP or a regulatory subunit of cAMP-dependent protein kinases [Niastella yeongjuensis]